MTTFIFLFFWAFIWAIQYWVCRNSCAKHCWGDAPRNNNWGIGTFKDVIGIAPLTCMIPILGFFLTFSFIRTRSWYNIEGVIDWQSLTFKYIPSAWNSTKL